MPNYHQGRFKPNNPTKYKGDSTNIIYRSQWECQFMMYLDKHPEVVSWSSEELVIPYISPIDGRPHRYFVDFVFKKNNGETIVVEIKPYNQTIAPVLKEGQQKRTYIKQVQTYGINTAKWKAADKYCKNKGWKFVILTEKDLKRYA